MLQQVDVKQHNFEDAVALLKLRTEVREESCWLLTLGFNEQFLGCRQIPLSIKRNHFTVYPVVKQSLHRSITGFYIVRISFLPEPDDFDNWLFDVMRFHGSLFEKSFHDYVIYSDRSYFSFRHSAFSFAFSVSR